MHSNYEHLITPHLLDSRLKLHLLLQYFIHPGLALTSTTMSDRLRENPWAIAEALDELAQSGLLARHGGDAAAIYRLGIRPEYRRATELLVDAFNDPLRRDFIYAQVNTAHRERQYHRWFSEPRAVGLASLVIA